MRKLLKIKSLFIFLSCTLSLFIGYKIFYFTNPNVSNILIYISLVAIICALFFLAYYDMLKMEVHNTGSFLLMISLLLINVVFYIYKGPEIGIEIVNGYIYVPLLNFYAAIILGSIFLLIVLISKEKALGQGDVRIAIIVGLLIGYNNILVWVYITVFSALFYSLIVLKEKKKIRDTHIPFVPFMILGVLIILLKVILSY